MRTKQIAVLLFLAILTLSSAKATSSEELVVVGNIPGRYLENSGDAYALGAIHMKDRIIQSINLLKSQKDIDDLKKNFAETKIVFANSKSAAKIGESYDYIFPGLIDLHNHTKQNNLNVWDLARGQFANRFEWRAWNLYTLSVSANMNPWIGFGKPVECAVFRWSELQAMVIGTTYLQGPSSCINDFAIHQVEDAKSYISKKAKVQAPTDLVIPGDMTYVWDVLRPLIEKGMSYEEALAKDVNDHCDLPGIDAKSVTSSAGLKILKDQKLLVSKCTKGTLHPKFVRYVYWVHPTIASKKNYIKSSNRAAIIAHLAEGRRDDYYNQIEFELVKLMGLDQPYMNFVHGVGIKKEDLTVMGKKKMGLIWSPFSNLLLYGETLDIKAAREAGVIMSIGSDWLPTGSRGILEEIKLAASYIDKDPDNQGLKKIFTDEELYLLLTENPAKMINHWDINPAKGEHGIGQVRVGAMASLIVTSKLDENPYTSLVRKTWGNDLNLVLIDGKPVYGNEGYLEQAGIASSDYEKMPSYPAEVNEFGDKNIPTIDEKTASKKQKQEHLETLGSLVAKMDLGNIDNCRFKSKKGFVNQNSIDGVADLKAFYEKTGLNIDRFEDMQKLIAINMMTQSRNATGTKDGKKDFAVTGFPALHSCNDDTYTERLTKFVIPDDKSDEFNTNRDPASRLERRKEQRLGAVPKKLERDYAK